MTTAELVHVMSVHSPQVISGAKKSAMALGISQTAEVVKKDLRVALQDAAVVTQEIEAMLLWRKTVEDEPATDGHAKAVLLKAAGQLERLWQCNSAAQGLLRSASRRQ